MSIVHVKSVTVADFTGTVTVYNSQGSTQTANATDLARPTDWNSVHNLFSTIGGNTAGQSTVSGQNIVLAGGNNVTLSANGSTVSIVGPVVPAQTAYVFSNSNGVSWGTNGSTVTATVATNYAASNHSHGNPTLNLTNLSGTTASNSAGLTLSLSAAAQGLTSQSNQALSAANGSFTFQTATFANSNGVSFSTGTQGIYASVETSYAASNHSHGNPTLALTNLSGTTASNSAGLTLSLSAAAGGGGADGYNILAAGTQTATTAGTVLFSNANGITFGMSDSTRITASHNGLTTARASNDGVGLNTAATQVTWTVNSNGISLNAGAYLTTAQPVGAYLTTARASNDAVGLNTAATQVTWTVNSSGISLNAGAYLTTAAQSNHSHGNPTLALTNLSGTTASNSAGLTLSLSAAAPGAGGGVALAAGTQTATSGTIVFANSNGVTFGMSGSSQITASAAGAGGGGAAVGVSTMGDTAGNTGTFNTGTVFFAGSNSMTLSQQTGAGGATVWMQPPVSQLTAGANITLSTAGSTISIIGEAPGGGAAPSRRYIEIQNGERFTTIANLSETRLTNRLLLFPFWMDGTGLQPNTVRLFITGIASSNRSLAQTYRVGLYSQVNDTQISLLTSDSIGFAITASSQSSVWNGFRALDFTRMSGATMTTEGRWVLGFVHSNSANNTTVANVGIYGGDPMPVYSGQLIDGTSQASNASSQIFPWWGGYNVATTNGFPNSIAMSQVNGMNSQSILDVYAIIKEV